MPRPVGEQAWEAFQGEPAWCGEARDPRGQPQPVEGGHFSNHLWEVLSRGVTKFHLHFLKDHFGCCGVMDYKGTRTEEGD